MSRAKKDTPPRFPAFRDAFLKLMGDMTLEQFAKKLDMSRATVGFYAAGKRIPDALGLKKIAEKCGVSADWLLGITKIRSQDIGTRQICEKIGLEEEVVVKLQEIYKRRSHTQECIEGINSILSSSLFPILARDYIHLKRFTEKVNTEYKEHSFDELEDPIHEEGEAITLKGCRACDYYRSKIIDQFSTILDMDIPVYQTTAAYLSLLEEGLEEI